MCSVVGYIGKGLSREFIMAGLARLEYRGYDSAGFACLDPHDSRIMYAKSAGRLQCLVEQVEQTPIDGFVSIGHTRWSTHGKATKENAHPHFDCEKKISVVHNGIIENHHKLRKQLEEGGHIFHSQTDTEVVAHLFEVLLLSHKTFKAAVVDLVNHLEGAYALIVLLQDYPDRMVLIRKRSPLCVGIGDDEMFIASDLLAFADKTSKVLFIPDKSFAIIRKDMIELYSFNGHRLAIRAEEVAVDLNCYKKNEYEHYMLKEIYEQKNTIHTTINFLSSISTHIWDHIGISARYAQQLNKLHLIGCGTSWHAARIAQFFFEHIIQLPTQVFLASEFRHMSFFPEEKNLYIVLSQSGETADTLEALRLINSMELPTIALTNVASSTMVREAGGFLLTHAGPEIAVASTKSFSTQLAALYWLVHRLGIEKGILSVDQFKMAEEDILVVAEVLENSIEVYKFTIINSLARRYAQYKKALFLGRHISYPFALEAALKLKEIAYVFAQCYPAGELKHGALALVDTETPVFVFSHQDPVIYQKLVSNVQEVKARGAHVVAFTFDGQDELCRLADTYFVIPNVKPLLGPLAMTGLMQFFFYAIAKELGCPIDKPRNLAKSVTVE